MSELLPQNVWTLASTRTGTPLHGDPSRLVGGYVGGFLDHLSALRGQANERRAREIVDDFTTRAKAAVVQAEYDVEDDAGEAMKQEVSARLASRTATCAVTSPRVGDAGGRSQPVYDVSVVWVKAEGKKLVVTAMFPDVMVREFMHGCVDSAQKGSGNHRMSFLFHDCVEPSEAFSRSIAEALKEHLRRASFKEAQVYSGEIFVADAGARREGLALPPAKQGWGVQFHVDIPLR